MEVVSEEQRALVAGKYRLSRLLGRGGMGSVWEGVHTTLGTRVAVKFIESEYVNSPEARTRFENEARAAATLKSKHVVEVYDHGVMDDGRPFIVMEFLQGEPLDKRLDRVGRLHPKDAARLLGQVCRALSRAHAAHIVHRDLKPENVFLVWDDEDGEDVAKVVDFGIAKFTESAVASSSATRTGSVLGTPYYMSPEQARGLRSVDHRSDLWSLGVIAYRCIVGHLPFDGEALGDLLVKLCTAPIPVPSHVAPDVPPGFDAWLHKALMRDPSERFQSAAELSQSLAAVCGLSVRGPYATADAAAMPPSMQSGPYSALQYSATPMSATPMSATPMSATPMPVTPVSAHIPAAEVTGGPLTQTATSLVSKPKVGGFIAAGFALVVVLGIGGVVLAKALSGASAEAGVAAAVSAQAPARLAPEAATAVAATPLAAPAPQPAPAAPPSVASSASPSAETAAPAAVAAAKPVAAARPAAKPLAARPPAAKPPAPKPAAPSKPAPKPEIDLGY